MEFCKHNWATISEPKNVCGGGYNDTLFLIFLVVTLEPHCTKRRD